MTNSIHRPNPRKGHCHNCQRKARLTKSTQFETELDNGKVKPARLCDHCLGWIDRYRNSWLICECGYEYPPPQEGKGTDPAECEECGVAGRFVCRWRCPFGHFSPLAMEGEMQLCEECDAEIPSRPKQQ